jgi:hypothetical protein
MGYLDPGLFGILSQAGLAVLFVLVSVFAFFAKPIRKYFKRFSKNDKTDPSSSTKQE